jgi:hypothetical protein
VNEMVNWIGTSKTALELVAMEAALTKPIG